MRKPNIVCLLNVENDHFTFTWSQGPASFEPYRLEGQACVAFNELAVELREKLSNVVKSYLSCPDLVPEDSLAMARTGYELYKQMFNPAADQRSRAKEIKSWLEGLRDEGLVETLEFVVDGSWSMPWNVLYDQKPDKQSFLESGDNTSHWSPFWGVRYNLSGGKRVDPRYRNPRLVDPKLLMVIDASIQTGLPEEQQKQIADFVQTRNLLVVHTKDDLRDAIEDSRPDVLYWLSHAEPEALVLDGEGVSPSELYRMLTDDDEEGFGGIAFLNGCQTAERSSNSFVDAFKEVGFSGMVGTEHQTIDTFASPLGIDFLTEFLSGDKPIGSILHRLRKQVPLGLLYGAYCPPGIHVGTPESVEESKSPINDVVAVPSNPLGNPLAVEDTSSGKVIAERNSPLPDRPYPSLDFYTHEHRALFAGRDEDVERFAALLDLPDCRILVLHGESGVGKSSFLRAGVIPYLEDECFGYHFLRNQATESSQRSVLFIRATDDLTTQIAQTLWTYCQTPYSYQTPLGGVIEVDLKSILQESLGAEASVTKLRRSLRQDLSLLGNLLERLSERLPFTLVIVIDQCEEIFTLVRTPAEKENTLMALSMLRRTLAVGGQFKIILSLRTEYYGRLIDRLRHGLASANQLREYLLTDFDEAALVEAILRPTLRERIRYTTDLPYEKYGFVFEQGVAQAIANDVVRQRGKDSVLPLVQVVCSQLYDLVNRREGHKVTRADLQSLGGIEGGMQRHVEALVDDLVKDHAADRRPLQRLFASLKLAQPDGSLTTALLPDEEVRRRWTGSMDYDRLLSVATSKRLLRTNTQRLDAGQERRLVSLGHDALAKVATEWERELDRFAELRKWAMVIGGTAAIALAMGALALSATKAKKRAEASADELRNSVNEYYTLISEETLLEVPGLQELRKQLLQKAKDFHDRLATREPDDPQGKLAAAKSHYQLGQIQLDLIDPENRERDLKTAQHSYDTALRILEKLDQEDTAVLALLGRVHNAKGNAYSLVSESHDLQSEEFRTAHRNALRRFETAFDYRKRVVDLDPSIENRRLVASTLMSLGNSQFRAAEPDSETTEKEITESIQRLKDAQDVRKEILDSAGQFPYANVGEPYARVVSDLGKGYESLALAQYDAGLLGIDDEDPKSLAALQNAFNRDLASAVRAIALYEARPKPSLDDRYQLGVSYKILGDFRLIAFFCSKKLHKLSGEKGEGVHGPNGIKALTSAISILTRLASDNQKVAKYQAALADATSALERAQATIKLFNTPPAVE